MITKANPFMGARTLLSGARMYRRAFQIDPPHCRGGLRPPAISQVGFWAVLDRPYSCVRQPTVQLGTETDVLRNARVVSRKLHPLLIT